MSRLNANSKSFQGKKERKRIRLTSDFSIAIWMQKGNGGVLLYFILKLKYNF